MIYPLIGVVSRRYVASVMSSIKIDNYNLPCNDDQYNTLCPSTGPHGPLDEEVNAMIYPLIVGSIFMFSVAIVKRKVRYDDNFGFQASCRLLLKIPSKMLHSLSDEQLYFHYLLS